MKIRMMTPADVQFAFASTVAEGWSGETREVFETFLANDPRGCFVAEYESTPAGICVATRYRTSGFIGELVVAQAMRGRGIGRTLFRTAIEYLKATGIHDIYLDGDLDAVPFYERTGFRRVCRSLRFVGSAKGPLCPGVRSFLPADAPSVCEIDRELFGDDRSDFLERRLALFPGLCFVFESDGRITGYAMGRPGVGVVSVGPWASRGSDADALSLLGAVALRAGPERLRLGVLEANPRAVRVVRSCADMEEQTPCWRMVLGSHDRLGIHADLIAMGSAAKG